MTASVYENLSQLTYRELLTALANIKEKEMKIGNRAHSNDMTYKDAVMVELANRQREF